MATLISACGSGDGGGPTVAPTSAAGGRASVADLDITGAIVPAPASPDVAAAYFTITNHGSTADDLVSVTSDVSTETGLHTYSGSSMVALPKLTIGAGRTARLAVGSYHVMIMNPTRVLTAGQSVSLGLTFTHAGTVTVTAPVVAGTGPQDDHMGSMPGMSSMPGMQ
jgi:copper(I)-binding protein